MSEIDLITLQHDAEVRIDAMLKGFNIADPERNAHGKWMENGRYRVSMSIVCGRSAGLDADIGLTELLCTELSCAVKDVLSEVFNCEWFLSFISRTDAEGYGTSNKNDARYIVAEIR